MNGLSDQRMVPQRWHRPHSSISILKNTGIPSAKCSTMLLVLFLLISMLMLGIILSDGTNGRRKRGGTHGLNTTEAEEEDKQGGTMAEASRGTRRRLRRQTLPSDNVLVYATNSNVSVADQVQVLSAESHIHLLEDHLNITVWSNASLLQMTPNGQYLTMSASKAIALAMALSGGARLQGTGDTLTLQLNQSSAVDPLSSSDNGVQSRLEADLTGQRVNVSWTDTKTGAITFKASNGRAAALVATEWNRPNAREELSIISAPVEESGNAERQRELSIVANSPVYQVQIRLIGAETELLFRGAHLNIPPDHRSLLLRALGWHIRIQSQESPFELQSLDGHLRVNSFDEALILEVQSDVLELHVGRLSRLLINRSTAVPGKVRFNGALINGSSSPVSLTDRMELISHELRLSVDQTGSDQSVLIDATKSHLRLFYANRTMASLMASKHFVEMIGGKPLLEIGAGNVSVEMEVMDEEEQKGQKEMKELDTEIVPKELLREGIVEEEGRRRMFGIALPPLSAANSSSSSSFPSKMPSSTSPSSPSSSSLMASSPAGFATPRMAAVHELFTFRQTFPPSSANIQHSSTPSKSNDSLAASFPSPAPELFTFAPSQSDTDFLVGQFETVPSGSAFPISATISALQFPEIEEAEQRVDEQFPGIRRENLLIWRPEDIVGTTDSGGGGATTAEPETYSSVEEKGRSRRKSEDDEDQSKEAELEMDIAVGGEDDVRAERLRRELGQGIERMIRREERRKKDDDDDDDQDEQSEGGGRGGAGGRMNRMRGDEDDRKVKVANVQLEHVEEAKGMMRPAEQQRKEVVRVHFTLASDDQTELERAIHRMNGMQRRRAEEVLGHEVLSDVRLLLDHHHQVPAAAVAVPAPSSTSSSTLSAISAHSLPVLFAGSLSLAFALLTMLVALRPSIRAISKVQNWMKMKNRRRKTERRNSRAAATAEGTTEWTTAEGSLPM